MSARMWAGRVVRIGSGLAVVALAAAVVLAAEELPDGVSAEAGPALVTVDPPRTTLVCAGPLVLPDDTRSGDSAFDPTPVAPVESVLAVSLASGSQEAAAGTLTALGGVEQLGALTPGDGAGDSYLTAPGAPVVVRADPTGTAPARVAGVSSSVVSAGDLRGLAAASCQRPATELWLVGGSTSLESSAQLVIDNAGSTTADVQVSVWGPSGPVELAGGAQHLVPPAAEKVLVLPAMAAEQRRLVVRVVASGGSVAAHVQDSRLTGFTAAGTELVVPGALPSRRQVVAGIVVPASEPAQADAATLRVLVPGDVGTTARVALLGPGGVAALPGADVVDLGAGEVTDLSLAGLPAGTYAAVVDADVPVVAAAMVTRPGLAGELDDTPTLERAWAASAEPGHGGVVALPVGVSATVLVTAVAEGEQPGTGSASGVLRAYGPRGQVGEPRELEVGAGSTVAVPTGTFGAGVTSLELTTDPADDGAAVALTWGVALAVTQPDGELASVLVPTSDLVTTREVPVRGVGRLGLG